MLSFWPVVSVRPARGPASASTPPRTITRGVRPLPLPGPASAWPNRFDYRQRPRNWRRTSEHRVSRRIACQYDRALPSAEVQLLGRFRMPATCFRQPYGPTRVVNAVPETTAAGDLVLPLLQRYAVHSTGAQLAPERVLARAAISRVGADPLPRHASVGRSDRRHLLPSTNGVTGGIAKVPSAPRRWGCNPLAAFGHPVSRWVRPPPGRERPL